MGFDLWRHPRARLEVADPPGLAVSVAEMKAHRVVEHSADDALIATLIAAAVGHVERATNRLLTARAATLRLPDFPPRGDLAIALPGGRVAGPVTVGYVDATGAAQTLSGDEVSLLSSTYAESALLLDAGDVWPVVRPWGLSVTVEYIAGWAAVGSPPDYGAAIPPEMKTAVMMLAGEFYERRELSVAGASVAPALVGLETLLAPWRLHRVV